MIARLRDLVITRDGEQLITIATRENFAETYDALHGAEIDVTIKKKRAHRSLDANNYCWVLCERIAEELAKTDPKASKESVYRQTIREVGIYKDITVDPEVEKTLAVGWSMIGTGWLTERVDFDHAGEKVILRCYYGSSTYNTRQMSRVIDSLIEDCRALGIQTETPEQIAKIKSLWANTPKQEEKKK